MPANSLIDPFDAPAGGAGGPPPAVAANPPAAPPVGSLHDPFDDHASGTQSLTAAGGPVSKGLGSPVEDVPSKYAGIPTQMKASLPTGIDDRLNAYASTRFPDMPLQQARSRYGVEHGRLFYVDTDGRQYFEEPEFKAPTSGEGLVAGAKALASGVGPSIQAIGGIAGGVGTAGFAGGIPGAAAGGFVGDQVRQGLAATLTGEQKPISDRLLQSGGAALEEGAGQAIGLGATKLAAKAGLARTPAYSVPDASEAQNAAKRISADQMDPIILTPGEATGDKTLLRRQKVLANTTQGEETFGEFYKARNKKVGDAINQFMGQISGDADYAYARRQGVEGAKAAVGVERKELQTEAKPLYDTARTVENADTQPVLDLIDSKTDTVSTPVRTRLEQIRNDLMRKTKTVDGAGNEVEGTAPDGRIAKIDEVKKSIDDMINAAKSKADTGIGASQIHHLEEVRTALLEQADKASPEYGKARGIYEQGMPAVTAVEKGLVGDVAKLEPTTNDALRASRILFSPVTSSPADVAQAREAFTKAGKQEEWRALVRSHLQETFESIPEAVNGATTNIGGNFYRAVFGNAKKEGMLIEAVKDYPDIGRNMHWLMDTLKATSQAAKGESFTAFAQAGQKEIAAEAKPLLSSAVETLEIWKSPSRIAQYYADLSTGKYSARMSEILTSPDGVAKLKELRKLSPGSAGAAIALSHILTTAGTNTVEGAVNAPSDRGAPMTQGQRSP